jgi:KipI family sensor histidine kinase inhibitor
MLVDLASAAEVIDLHDSLLAQGNRALTAVVPAARTVLIGFDPALIEPAAVTELVGRCTRPNSATELSKAKRKATTGPVLVPVHYDGADLAAVAEQSGLSVEAVISHHLDAEYTVQFCGFSPGFGYLSGLDQRLQLPRLASPRPVAPAGSVAIADEYTGIYPRASPGGWRLIGRSELALFDIHRDPPAVLSPGTTVRFVRQ